MLIIDSSSNFLMAKKILVELFVEKYGPFLITTLCIENNMNSIWIHKRKAWMSMFERDEDAI